LLAVWLALWLVGRTSAAPPDPDAGGVAGQVVSGDEVAATLDYWTPERMAEAIPAAPDLPGVGRLRGAADVAATSSSTYAVPHNQYAQLPYRASGKVYFTHATDGQDYVCSGAAVGGRVVLTAGHCVSDGAGHFHRNWLFVPAYFRGSAPYDRWPGRTLLTFDAWHVGKNYCRDVAFAVVGHAGSPTLEERLVGSLQLVINQPPTRTWQLLGYPRYPEPLFDGELMWTTVATLTSFYNGLGCTTPFPPMCVTTLMAQGASGGPWLLSPDENAVSGVVSFIPRGSNLLCSPYFDAAVAALHAQALGTVIKEITYLPVIRR
jgi:hypothetical protein